MDTFPWRDGGKAKAAEVRDGKRRESVSVCAEGSNDFASISFADPIPLSLYYDVIHMPK